MVIHVKVICSYDRLNSLSHSLKHDLYSTILLLDLLTALIPLLPPALQEIAIEQVDEQAIFLLSQSISQSQQPSSTPSSRWLFSSLFVPPSIPSWACHLVSQLHTPHSFFNLHNVMTREDTESNLAGKESVGEEIEKNIKGNRVVGRKLQFISDDESDGQDHGEEDSDMDEKETKMRKRRRKEFFQSMLQSISQIAQRNAKKDVPSSKPHPISSSKLNLSFLSETNTPMFISFLLKVIRKKMIHQRNITWISCVITFIVDDHATCMRDAFTSDLYMQTALLNSIKSILHSVKYFRQKSVSAGKDELTVAARRISQLIDYARYLKIEKEEMSKLIAELYDNLQLLILESGSDVSLQPLE